MALSLSAADIKARGKIYERVQKMMELKNKKMPHFAGPDGDRSFMEYIDDSERIINGYTLSRETQGKQAWQSNMLDNVSRAKLRAIASGVGLSVPDMRFQAKNKDGLRSPMRAEIFKNITTQTFDDGNPVLHNFLETWTLLSHGVLFEYEGYQTGGSKQRIVTSFDSRTGEVEIEQKYVKGDGKPKNVILNPQEFFWWDFNIRTVQEQPHICWIQNYTRSELEEEFGKYKNFNYVVDRKNAQAFRDAQSTLYFDKWQKRVEQENDYEVIRWFSKEDDAYEVWVNGVPLLRAPLLWSDKDGKYYPFIKSIAEPFANTNFFVGLSLAGILEGVTEARSSIINTLIDKLYRSMDVPLLIGLQNKDLFDWEAEFVNHDNRFYVPDVAAVKPLPIAGVNQGELAMLQILDRSIDSISVDRAQQGIVQGGGKTAREVVTADQHAQELKGMLYLFLEDLWYQKTRLRMQNIITHYLKDKAAAEHIAGNIITVKDYTFGDGARGILDIHVAKTASKIMSLQEIQAREQMMQKEGVAYKIISITYDYCHEWQFDFEVVPDSFHKADKAKEEHDLMTELQTVPMLWPEFFAANKDKFLEEYLELQGKHMDEYNPAPPPMPAVPGMPGAQPGAAPAQPGAPMPGAAPAAPATPVLGLK